MLVEDSYDICHSSCMITRCNLDPIWLIMHRYTWVTQFTICTPLTNILLCVCCLLDLHQCVTRCVCVCVCVCVHLCDHVHWSVTVGACVGVCACWMFLSNIAEIAVATHVSATLGKLTCILQVRVQFFSFSMKNLNFCSSYSFSSILQSEKHFLMLSAFAIKELSELF